jgi:Flp pilus assembly protein TadB
MSKPDIVIPITLKTKNMKSKLYLLSLTAVLFFTSMTTNAALVSGNQPSKAVEQTDSRLAEIKQRVEEIRAMDKSQLSKSERRNLRNELKDMKKELRRGEGGIHISTAAIIAAILLVALILVLVL